MKRIARSRAGRAISRPDHRQRIPARVAALLCTLGILAIALGAAANIARPLPTTSVGRNYARPTGPRVDPVATPARVAKVAIVPGSKDAEAWAFGHTHARKEGYAQADPQGQGVFLRYTRATGWQITEALLGQDGRPTNPSVFALSLASTGEGWGVGGSGLIFHRRPGGQWKSDAQASQLTGVELADIDLKEDAQGLFGWAVGGGPTFLRLVDGRWSVDNAAGRSTSNTLIGNVVSVAAVSREEAWAVASGARELELYHRTAAQGWQRVVTGKPLFDTAPSATPGAGGVVTINQYVTGSAVASDGVTTWVTGALQPVDSQRYASQRGPGNDQTRPFALRIDGSSGAFRSYCPPIYQLSSAGVASTARICDESFPFATGTLPGLTVLPGGTVFAGGFGMFQFNGRRWTREPNVAGIVSSVAFHSATEGWISTYGNRTGDGAASSTSATLGHWTSGSPQRKIVRRWPYPSREAMEAIALSPDGGRSAIAVGGAGTIVTLEPGVGFDLTSSPTKATLHDIAWPSSTLAFAVGESGTILRYDGSRWLEDAASRVITRNALYSVAFRGSIGYAVGAKGTLLRFDGSRWSADSGSALAGDKRLSAVAFAGEDAIVVGDRSTIITRTGAGPWRLDRQAPVDFATGQEGLAPHLLSVAGLPDGRAYAGGGSSLLLERKPGARFARSTMPILSGSIHTLTAIESRGRVRLLASTGTASSKFSGPGIVEPGGWLYEGDASGWRSVGDQRVAATGPELDAPVRRDAVYDIAVGADGRGFAAGGFPADLVDDDGHLFSEATGSIWRVSMDAAAEEAPGQSRATANSAPGSISFAFLGDSACADGLCSATMGSGTRADEILAGALADISASANSGGTRFVAFGGDMRRLGLPDELEPVRGLLDQLPVPFYASLGDKDLFGGLNLDGGATASNGYFLSTFANRPAPWGTGAPPQGILPVSVPGETQPDAGMARSYYSFDYAAGGKRVLRMVFLDTSRTPFVAASANPRGDQVAWLQNVLGSAQTAGIPSIVVMHQPFITPASQAAEAAGITAALTSAGAAAVLTSHDRVNRSFLAPASGTPGAFQVFAAGSAGTTLGGDLRPEHGAYHSWLQVSVPVDGPARTPSVRSMPILESVVLSAKSGRTTTAGGALKFSGLARIPDVGGGHINGNGNPIQSRAHYINYPMPPRCGGLLSRQDGCTSVDALVADHRFSCLDDRLCAFVREDPAQPGQPLRTGGALTRDAQSGLLCTFESGTTQVRLQSGTAVSQMPITIRGGSGPCNPRIIDPPPEPPVIVEPEAAPETRVLGAKAKASAPILKPKTFEVAAIPALAPPPVQPAPAPPGGGAAKREEEREAASEKSDMTALPVGARTPSPWTGGAIGLIAALATITLAGHARPRAGSAHIAARSRTRTYAYAIGLPSRSGPAPEDR